MLSKKQQKNIPEQPAVYKAPAPAPAPVMFGFSKQYLAANRKIVEPPSTQRVLPPTPSCGIRWG